jgi:hypothetical protein
MYVLYISISIPNNNKEVKFWTIFSSIYSFGLSLCLPDDGEFLLSELI